MAGTSVTVVAIDCKTRTAMSITFTQPEKKLNYDDLAQEVCHKGLLRLTIAGVEVQGTFDVQSKYLVWVADYSIRDEAYIKALIARS